MDWRRRKICKSSICCSQVLLFFVLFHIWKLKIIFTLIRCHQPAVIFIDEIDSLLCQRSEQEHESSRKIKTEFLVQLVYIQYDNI